ncbi:MAG: subfamily B ATP-binding cassette protein MsbA [Verrucomicrobiales bacterium]|jgi:subfamily B ATP-binding cassette protein MsbA
MDKLSRKDISKMSTMEFVQAAKIPYKRLLGRLKPYKTRFAAGIVFGVVAGLFNAVMLFVFKFVFGLVLTSGFSEEAKQLTQSLNTIAEPEKEFQVKEINTALSRRPPEAERIQTELKPSIPRENVAAALAAAEATEDKRFAVELNRATGSSITVEQVRLAKEEVATIAQGGKSTSKPNKYIDKLIAKIPEPDLQDNIWAVIGVCSLIPLMILIRGMLGYMHQYCMMWVGNHVLYDLRSELFSKLLNQSLSFFNKQKTGELIQTVFNQTRMAQTAGTNLASDLIKHPISIISIVAFLLIVDPWFTFAALVLFPLCLIPVVAVSNKVRKAGGKEEEEAGMLMVTMQESFAGIRVVKAHAREEFESNKFNAASKRMLEFIMRWRKAMEIVGPFVEAFASLGIAAGLVYAWKYNISTDEFLILYLALIGMYPHAKALSKIQIQLQKCLVATTKVFAFIDEPPGVGDKEDAAILAVPAGRIEFRDVHFSYHKKAPALNGINLNCEPGKTYALVGESGAGKTTMLALIMRFYDPEQGGIYIDGNDLRSVTQQSLRDQIGIVNQETFLFHDTIYNNIRYGRLDATREEIEFAANQAFAHKFIIEQPNGYETILGDKGCTLSGGQQQRLSIARAFLRNAPILLLDEAMSALDSKAEKKVQKAIEKLEKGKTVIAIAHRLSTVLDADQIVVMDQGQIIDVGTHAELLRKSDIYQRLYHIQFHGGE